MSERLEDFVLFPPIAQRKRPLPHCITTALW